MRDRYLIVGAIAFALVVLALELMWPFPKVTLPPEFRTTDITGRSRPVDALQLRDHRDRPRSLRDFRGKVVLLYFGYTQCRDACTAALADMAQVIKNLGRDGKEVQGIFISTDPERDTAPPIQDYVTAFDPSFIGLRGRPDEVEHVLSSLRAASARSRNTAHDRAFSSAIFVLDREGRPRLYVDAATPSVESIIHDVRLLLQE